jgi:hypothetical protein
MINFRDSPHANRETRLALLSPPLPAGPRLTETLDYSEIDGEMKQFRPGRQEKMVSHPTEAFCRP